ncbi:unnamed protein product, partial [Porites evermanni]
DLSHTTYFSVSPPVRLAYDSIDSNSDGQDLPPLVILHGLFGSKTNWRTLARHFHKQTGRKLVSSLARVRNNGSLFQSNIYNIIITDNLFIFALDLAAVCIIRVSARQELTVSLASNCALYGLYLLTLCLVFDITFHMSKLELKFYTLQKFSNNMVIIKNSFLRSFFLTNLVKTETGFRWRINLEALENNLPEVSSFPTDFPHQHFDGKALFIGGARSDYVR